jgi:hypothetical protein
VSKAGFTVLILFLAALLPAYVPHRSTSYNSLNSELGIVYRPPSVSWDGQQWDAIFKDPAPPMGWAILPVGSERCNGITKNWLDNARRKGFKLAILFTPFITTDDMRRTIDCAIPLGFRRAIVDEYISYQSKDKGRPLCTVVSELRDLSITIKRRYPSFEFLVNDNWHTWMVDLARGQSPNCGAYPLFRADMAGVSVLSKYRNPVNEGGCGHPTSQEMLEQLIDLKPTVRDYSRTGRTFVWQLNQNWYPGGENVLKLFRVMKAAYGWDRFFLFGPTTESPTSENWGYNFRGGPQNCSSTDFEWYLPARQYLGRIGEGRQPSITLSGPSSVARDSVVSLDGRITVGSGLPNAEVELQYIPPPGSPQSFRRQITAPSGAILAFVGIRINRELPNPIKGAAHFSVQRAQLFEAGSNDNLVNDGEFNNGTSGWLIVSSTPVRAVTSGSEKSIEVDASANQSTQITSSPIRVKSGRNYIVNFDAKIFTEARNNAYFFVSWNKPAEIRRDRMFMNFPLQQTLMATSSNADGRFRFSIQPTEAGVYQVFAFFGGNRTFQPAQAAINLKVN